MKASTGFTLVELVVALFITAIMFAMGYAALSQTLTGRKQVEEQATRLLAVQTALRVMEQDFELLQPRPVRNLIGGGYQSALSTSQTEATNAALSSSSASPAQTSAALVSFTRGGWANPAGIARSELQRVSYVVNGNKLVRQHWPVLDATSDVAVLERELLDKVDALSFRFMDASHTWQTAWPPAASGLSPLQVMRMRPVAVEITLQLHDWGTLVRIVEVAG
jgi:general secretion pathway protein J